MTTRPQPPQKQTETRLSWTFTPPQGEECGEQVSAPENPQTWMIPLSHDRPPLTANQRLHWAQRARITKQLRHEAKWKAKAQKIPPQKHITFQYHYQPTTNRKRDQGNLMPTHKALLDGIVDAGIIPDDTPNYATETIPKIHPPKKGKPKTWITITTRKETKNES